MSSGSRRRNCSSERTSPIHNETIATVEVKDLTVVCIVGIRDWERRTAQQLSVDFQLDVPIDRAIESGEVADTVDYSFAARQVAAYIIDRKFGLLESLVAGSITFLKECFPKARRIRFVARKPGAIENAAYAGLSLEMSYPAGAGEIASEVGK